MIFYGFIDLDPAAIIPGGKKVCCPRGDVGSGAIDFAVGTKRWDSDGRRGFGDEARAAKRET